jgi:3-oxoacyl-[acyl-carrier protein] reductase
VAALEAGWARREGGRSAIARERDRLGRLQLPTEYAATKAEVVILTRRIALELGQHGITVNAVAPGFVRTDMTQRGRGAADWPGTEERVAARAMMGRIGEPEDIANAVVFLASPESGWITAQVLAVDGGRMDYIGHG